MISIANLNLIVSDGSTIASTEIYGEDKKTYINIGSGNVFKLSWSTFGITDPIDHYCLIIRRHDTTIDAYYDIFDKNIGLVNEFYVDSSLLPTLPLQYMLSIYIVAYGQQGSVITSNVVNPYISKGSGTYVKAKLDGYSQSIMKRALAFVYDTTPVPDKKETVLKDASGRVLLSKDSKQLQAEATNILKNEDGWHVVQESYIKNDSNWHTADLKYEALVDNTGVIIKDKNDEPIYVL